MKLNTSGQNMVEYMLIFAVVVIVLLVGFAPNGFITKSLNQTMNLSVVQLELMAEDTFHNVYAE